MKPISQIIKEGEKLLKPEIELVKKLDEHYWQKGYPKLENQLKKKISTQAIAILEGVIEMCETERERVYEKSLTTWKRGYKKALTQVIEKLKEEISNL